MKQVIWLSIIALLAFSFMFSSWTKEVFNFWVLMTLSSGTLAGSALFFNRAHNRRLFFFQKKHIFIGVVSAAVLYAIFFVGKHVAAFLFSFAGSQIQAIYQNKEGVPLIVIAALLFFCIGPAEEIFWRGFVQFRMNERFGTTKAWIYSSLVYAGVHIASWNLILIATALICGLFWGFLFKRYNSLWPGLISHAVFDVLAFVVAPINF